MVIAVTCPLTDVLRKELDDLGVKVMERKDPLLLKLLIRHLRTALTVDDRKMPKDGKRPVKHPLPYDVPKPRYWVPGSEWQLATDIPEDARPRRPSLPTSD